MRRLLLSVVLLLMGVQSSPAEGRRLSVARRAPVVLVSFILDGAGVRASRLLESAAQAVEADTDLQVLPPSRVGLDLDVIKGCASGRRVECWCDAVRGLGADAPELLLVVGVQPAKEPAIRVHSLLFDVNAGGSKPGSQRIGRSAPVVLSDARVDTLSRYFTTVVNEAFIDSLTARDHHRPYGSVELSVDRDGLLLELDGRVVGTVESGETLLDPIHHGPHRLTVRDAARALEATRSFEVVRGAKARVEVRLDGGADASGTLRTATFWGGVGLATTGAVLSSVALALSPRTTAYDVGVGAPPRTSSGRFATFCELTRADPACHGHAGLLAAPLGYSVALTGVTWALGAHFVEREDLQWAPLVAGLVVGGLAYGLSAGLASGSEP